MLLESSHPYPGLIEEKVNYYDDDRQVKWDAVIKIKRG